MSPHGRAFTAALLCFAASGWLAATFAPWWQAISAAAVGLLFLVAGLSRITWAPEYSAPEANKQESLRAGEKNFRRRACGPYRGAVLCGGTNKPPAPTGKEPR